MVTMVNILAEENVCIVIDSMLAYVLVSSKYRYAYVQNHSDDSKAVDSFLFFLHYF